MEKRKMLILSECFLAGGVIARVGDIVEVDKFTANTLRVTNRGTAYYGPEPASAKMSDAGARSPREAGSHDTSQ